MVYQAFGKDVNPDDTYIVVLSYVEVTAVMILDTIHQAVITHTSRLYISRIPHCINMAIAVYTYTITDWGNPEQLQTIVW